MEGNVLIRKPRSRQVYVPTAAVIYDPQSPYTTYPTPLSSYTLYPGLVRVQDHVRFFVPRSSGRHLGLASPVHPQIKLPTCVIPPSRFAKLQSPLQPTAISYLFPLPLLPPPQLEKVTLSVCCAVVMGTGGTRPGSIRRSIQTQRVGV